MQPRADLQQSPAHLQTADQHTTAIPQDFQDLMSVLLEVRAGLERALWEGQGFATSPCVPRELLQH